MFTLPDILFGFVLPAFLSAVILLAAWRPWQRTSLPDGRWAGGLVIAAAFAIAYGKLVGGYRFPPTAADNWIVYFSLAAIVLGMLDTWLRPSLWIRLGATLILSAALIWLLVAPVIGNDLSRNAAIVSVAALSVAMTLWWFLLDQLASLGPRLLAPIALFLGTAGSAAILADSGLAQRGGFTLGAMAVILGAVIVMAAMTRAFSLAGGGTLAVAIVLFGTIVYARFYMYPEPTPRLTAAMAIVLIAPLFAWVAWLPGLRNRKTWQRVLIGLLAVLIAAAASAAVAGLGADRSPPSGEAD